MSHRGILFFADRLPPLIGGMEMHAGAFFDHFSDHPKFPIVDGDPSILFFNSGRWIEELREMRKRFPKARFVYRTGGNEILKAPLEKKELADHQDRQRFWVEILNETIDLLITNSNYTEERLRAMGVECPFFRSVGGVDAQALRTRPSRGGVTTLVSAARFVPYKNHALLIDVLAQVKRKCHLFELRLAGDGPLLESTQELVETSGLSSCVTFLGPCDNARVCEEIASADLYVQLSGDRITEVAGGRYVHAEGMGRSILEALTAGTFTVAGQGGALAEIVTSSRGFLVDLSAPDQIADLLAKLIAQPPPRAPFSDAYSWQRVFQRYEEVFDEIS